MDQYRKDLLQAVLTAYKETGSKRSAARKLGMSWATYRGRFKKAEAVFGPVDTGMDDPQPEVVKEELTIHQEHRLRQDNNRLKRNQRDLLKEIESLKDIGSITEQLAAETLKPPKWLTPDTNSNDIVERAVVTALLSDCHFDEVVDPVQVYGLNEYNREIATQRLQAFGENLVKITHQYIDGVKLEGLVLAMLGDMVGGNIHEELKETNEAGIIETVLYWSTELASLVEYLEDYYPSIFIPCVVGNHGRLDRKPRAKGRAVENFDYLLYKMLQRHFDGHDNITFAIPTSSDYQYKVYNTVYRITHGYQFRGGGGIAGLLSPLMIGDSRKRKNAQQVQRPYDYLMMGHWHQRASFKGIIVNGTTKGVD